MKNPPKVGIEFERTQARQLRALGYHVTRSAASRGPYDLDAEVALPTVLRVLWGRETQRILVQVKYTGRPPLGIPKVSPADWNKLYDLATQRRALAVLVARPKAYKLPLWWLITARKGTGGETVARLCQPFHPTDWVALPGESPLPASLGGEVDAEVGTRDCVAL